ncbi:50S ribosomal protein L32 [Candidatus Margulisiibacteriota bacterium]
MPMPKKRHSNVRQGKRRFSNYRLASKNLSRCPDCGAPTIPHHACPACGSYKGRTVKKKKTKEKKGKKEKE